MLRNVSKFVRFNSLGSLTNYLVEKKFGDSVKTQFTGTIMVLALVIVH